MFTFCAAKRKLQKQCQMGIFVIFDLNECSKVKTNYPFFDNIFRDRYCKYLRVP